jgi:hypothetical protein
MTSPELEEIRRKSDSILSRAQSDESFRQKLKDDPEGILRAEGLPDEAIGDFIREAELGEVAGYLRVADCGVTCTISSCGVSVIKAF